MSGKLLRKAGKIILYFIGVLVLLLIFTVIFIQTETFNKYALKYTLNELNSPQQQRNNKIFAETINGNILYGIRVNKGRVVTGKDTLLSFNYLEIKYDLWGLLDKRILLHEVTLTDPVIISSKIKAGDSFIWNFENLFTSGETDTSSSEFDWDVSVENLKIQNGFIRIAGDTAGSAGGRQEKRTLMQFFDYNQTDVSELNLEISAKYYSNFKNISIKNLSFRTNSDFNIRKLQLDANINEKDTLTELWNFELVTDRSDIKIYRLAAEDFNPFYGFNYEDLGNKNIAASIDILKFNFDDLVFFLPGLNFMDSVAAVKIDASGRYKDLNAEKIVIRLPNSVINLKGKIKNLHEPDSLYLDVEGKDIVINAKDIKSIYKNDIPDYSHMDNITLDLHYTGKVTDFRSEFRLNSAAGYAEGQLNLNTDNMHYSGMVNTRGLDLGRILKNKDLDSRLNLSAKFSGNGFELGKMSANVAYIMNSSRFGSYTIRSSEGVINANRGNYTLRINHHSSFGSAKLNGNISISNINNPVYDIEGSVANLDISKLTGDSDDNSDLNFTFDINGSGSKPENINGIYKLDVADSYYGGFEIPSTPVDAEITNTGSKGTVRLNTDMLEFNGEGDFRFGELVSIIFANITNIQHKLIENGELSKLNTGSLNESGLYTYPDNDMNFSFRLVTKDSIKLEKFTKPFGFRFNGSASGEIINTGNSFNSSVLLDVKNLEYQDSVIIVNNMKTDFVFNNDYTAGIEGLKIELNGEADRISYEGNHIDSVFADISMLGPDAEISFTGGMDTAANADVHGRLNLSSGNINADMDTVFINYAGYEIENRGNWVFKFEQGENLLFEQFNIKSKNSVVGLTGNFSFNNESNLTLEGNNIKITDIADIVNQTDSSYIISSGQDIKGEVSKLTVNFKGKLSEPVVTAAVSTNTLSYNENDMGIISAKINFRENSADAEITMKNAEGSGNLVIKGSFPFVNPFSGDTLLTISPASSPVDITLKADNFVLDYFSTLLSSTSSLRGVLNADLSAKGTASDPALSGNLKITKGGYLLPLTGMDYNFDASMSTDNFKLVLDNLSIYSKEDDPRNIIVKGSLDFKDMKITEIDLEARGEMVLLDKDVEQNELGVYGYMLGGTGTNPVKIEGSLDSLYIRGQFLIKEATISSVPMEGSGYNPGIDNFIYIDAANVSANFPDSVTEVTEEEYNLINPFERYKYKIDEENKNEAFVNLDLNVRTEKNIYASIDFNNITRDRLFGEIMADLDIKTVEGELQAYGNVEVAGDSYYRFYRDFKLNDSRVKFDGDIDNPILDIKGVYKSQKNNEQYGSVTTSEVEVVIRLEGYVEEPELTIKLYQDGSEVSGNDAQSDAITYLLFGRYKNELTASERTAVASTLGSSLGSLYASSYLSRTIREILPFIVDAQFNYTEGSVQSSDIELISEFGEARVKFGGKLLKDVKNFELVVDYPVNKLLNLDLPETLLLEFAREEKKQLLSSSQNDILTTEIKLIYRIKF